MKISLDEYKRQVESYLIMTYGFDPTEAKESMKASESYWRQLMKDGLTPKETAYGITINLL